MGKTGAQRTADWRIRDHLRKTGHVPITLFVKISDITPALIADSDRLRLMLHQGDVLTEAQVGAGLRSVIREWLKDTQKKM